MIWSPISKYFLAGRWNILSLYDMKAYFKTFGLGAEIFSAYIIWKYIKTFGLSAQIFSVCVIWKYITQSSFFCRHLGWKYSRPVSSGTISKHLGLGTEIISACASKYLCYWNIFQPVSSGSLSNMWWSWKWLCLHQDTTSFNLDPKHSWWTLHCRDPCESADFFETHTGSWCWSNQDWDYGKQSREQKSWNV